jgi:UDP-4-amino-4,6-dideoxy-N-acetyl-beta-L-altrosamine N-acetyltransferase
MFKLLDFRKAPKNLLMEVRNWRNNPDIARYFIIDEIDLEIHQSWINGKIKDGSDRAFLIMRDEDAKGCIYLRNINHHKTAEFGIFLNPSEKQGKGIGSLAIKEILSYAFTDLALEKVYLQVLDFNDTALSLYEKFGFEIEGKLRKHIVKNGKRVDIKLMGLLKNKWKNESD